ncbi:MAG TPA: hypothetical protein PKL83_06170, partial [bacterium]|nr:hypothetical protein [bacterium]
LQRLHEATIHQESTADILKTMLDLKTEASAAQYDINFDALRSEFEASINNQNSDFPPEDRVY